ncbi:hypothetical protein MOJ79_12950 [Calidifontimicrobium sp. SYSU G02091]|uniref:hypothetical protein n=1 Tax=Calidifontimicrobium sp. SYSU G02091 TaxID=2926421 RepID=UPI001F52FF3A|nr:hypothetical protein [Calidifontimicrobium sp. SYSU G02091]MCI1192749.1 hypothetical protein [Calidifontimicrobium sp. SYSU G02091]
MTPHHTVLTAIASLLLLAGCGGGDSAMSAAPASPPVPAPAPAPAPATPSITLHALDTGTATVAVPLTSQQGVVFADVPVTLHSEDNRLYATRWEDAAPVKTLLAAAANNGSVAARGQHLLAVYVQLAPTRRVIARESADGGRTWGAEVDLGAAPAGPAMPAACVWQRGGTLRRAVAWSDQPSQSEGPLVTAVHDGSAWRAPVRDTSAESSGAALACADDEAPEVVWRDHRHGSGSQVALYHARLDPASGATQSARRIVQPGYDPSMCRSGTRRFVGFHTGTNDAHVARSDDDWLTLTEPDLDDGAAGAQLDDSGKFVAVACSGEVVAAAWGDWPTKHDADALASTRQLALAVSRDGGTQWQLLRPADADTDQATATVTVHDGRVLVLWRAPSMLRLATIVWP